MYSASQLKLREFLRQSLNEAGDRSELADDDSLFISGRLDSLSMTRVVLFLEAHFGVDFGRVNFEVDLIDSLRAMLALVDTQAARSA